MRAIVSAELRYKSIIAEPTDAILIITDFVNNYLKHIVKRNNANYTEGALVSVSTDGDTYSFAIKGEPETTSTEFDFEV